MSAELTEPGPTRHTSAWWVVRDAVVILVASTAVGALCGVVWELWWTPPTGLVRDGVWYPDLEGVRQLFSATGLYVVVGLAGGVLLGAACAWLFDRVELVTLGVVAAGSVLAAWVMLQVGTALAPPDPDRTAVTADDFTELPGTLTVDGNGAYVAFPAGALTGVAVVFIGLTPNRRLEG